MIYQILKQYLRRSTLPALLCIFLGMPAAQGQNKTQIALSSTEKQEDPEEIIRRYRALYRQHPRRTDILFQLSDLLSRAGHHDEAADLLQAHLKKIPGDVGARLRLGDVLFAQNSRQAAYAQWDRVAKGATHAGPYRLTADRYRRHNMHAQAEAVFRQGRKSLKQPLLFARELAEVAEQQAHYVEAIQEYLLFLKGQPQYRPTVANRLREIARAGGPPEIFDHLSREVAQHPEDKNRIHLLIEYALPAGRAEELLHTLTKNASIKLNTGTHLFRIARYVLDNQTYATAVDAYRILLGRKTPAHIQARSHLGLAQSYEGLNQPDSARTYYQALIQGFPKRTESDEARFRLGLLLRDTDRNPEAALQTFQDLVATRRRTSWRYKALFEIVESHLQANRLDRAGLACRRIIQEKQGQEEAGEAIFRLAELHFLSGKPDSAQHLLEALLAGSRTHYVLNDALALSMLIQDGSGENNTLLKTFGNAQKLQRQHQFQQALTVCDSLNQHHPESPLTDRIQDARAHLLDALGRYPEAIQACRQLIATTPWSPFCPNAQMRLAHIYENRLGQYHDAKKAYQILLITYPESLEADQARERLRQIQKKIQDLDEKKTG